MDSAEVTQIMVAIEGLHGDVLTTNRVVGELQGQVGQLEGKLTNGINRDISSIWKWMEKRPTECPVVKKRDFAWKLVATVGGLSGWAAFIVTLAGNKA